MKRLCAAVCAVLLTACASLETTLLERLDAPAQSGTRWGILVTDMDGQVLLEHRADERFIPASNTKIFTTMAALRDREYLESPRLSLGTRLIAQSSDDPAVPDLILLGGGDPLLADGPSCQQVCLSFLADAVVDAGIVEIRNIVGDDMLFPAERWPPGWSQEDLRFDYGAPVSALSVNGNTRTLLIAPGESPGQLARLEWSPEDAGGDVAIRNRIVTVASPAKTEYGLVHDPGMAELDLFGAISETSPQRSLEVVVHDPPQAAAERLAGLLVARGVSVNGAILSQSRPLDLVDDPAWMSAGATVEGMRRDTGHAVTGAWLARLAPGALTESLRRISEDSDNLHAELVLNRLGLIAGTGSRAHGLARVREMLEEAGIDEASVTLHDGSGLSVYNRVTPRSMVQLLLYALDQDWGLAWRDLQPVAGRTGTLERRFRGTILEGRLQAKSGRMSSVDALSGYMTTASGRRLVFAILANDRPPGAASARTEIDAILLEIARRY